MEEKEFQKRCEMVRKLITNSRIALKNTYPGNQYSYNSGYTWT